MRRRVTFSRNLTLSLSRTCVSHCKYCAFQTHQPHLHTPDEVLALLDRAAKRSVKELLILTGDDPAHHPGVRGAAGRAGLRGLRRLRGVVLRARAGARAAAAHQPRRGDARGAGAAARGDGVAGADAGVDARRPRRPPGLADQGPGAAAADDPLGGRAEDPVHARDPGGHRRDARGSRRRAARAGRGPRRARPPAGGHPPELRPAPEVLRRGAGGDRDRRGRAVLAHGAARRRRHRRRAGVGERRCRWRTWSS